MEEAVGVEDAEEFSQLSDFEVAPPEECSE